jgi:hypothetical protein
MDDFIGMARAQDFACGNRAADCHRRQRQTAARIARRMRLFGLAQLAIGAQPRAHADTRRLATLDGPNTSGKPLFSATGEETEDQIEEIKGKIYAGYPQTRKTCK